MSLFNPVHRARARHAKLSDMTNQHDTAEERTARLEIRIRDYQAAEKRQLIRRGIALWTRTETEQLMAYEPKPRSGKVS